MPESAAVAVRTLLASLVRAALISDDRAGALWREAARHHHTRLASEPDAVAGLTIDGLWTLAVREAEAPEDRAAETHVEFGFPARCPFTLEDLTGPAFDVDTAVDHLRKSAATG